MCLIKGKTFYVTTIKILQALHQMFEQGRLFPPVKPIALLSFDVNVNVLNMQTALPFPSLAFLYTFEDLRQGVDMCVCSLILFE